MTTERLKKLLIGAMAANSLLSTTRPVRGDEVRRNQPRIGSWSNRIDAAATGTGQASDIITPYTQITLVRFAGFAQTAAATCSTSPVLSLQDIVTGSNVASITFSNGVINADAGALNLPIVASHGIEANWTTAAGTCGTVPSGIHFNVQYK